MSGCLFLEVINHKWILSPLAVLSVFGGWEEGKGGRRKGWGRGAPVVCFCSARERLQEVGAP